MTTTTKHARLWLRRWIDGDADHLDQPTIKLHVEQLFKELERRDALIKEIGADR